MPACQASLLIRAAQRLRLPVRNNNHGAGANPSEFPDQVPSTKPPWDDGFINPILCPYLKGPNRKFPFHE